jgi:hypothetical protein
LKTIETGKGHIQTSELDQAIDMWIEILDSEALAKTASKANAQRRQIDLEIDNDFRLQMTETLAQTRCRELTQTPQYTSLTTISTTNSETNEDLERPH